jgi:tyrosine-specific transport protein
MDVLLQKTEKGVAFSRVLSGTLMIAGTTIGAGMLGIPLLTAQAGFVPALVITFLVWVFMLSTGLLFLEVALWMPEGTNIVSMAQRFLGPKGKWLAGGMFVFLYYCLLIAYFAAGAPLLAGLFGIAPQGWMSYVLFGGVFGLIVALGAKCIDRTNIILTVALVAAYAALMGRGSSEVSGALLSSTKWSAVLIAVPVLFSAFGYHNVIPSLCTYFKKERRPLQLSIIFGTCIPMLMYVLWQWLVIGSVPKEAIAQALAQGQTATQALQAVTGHPWIYLIGKYFAFFAIVTSLLGVSFSMVDFLADGLKIARVGLKRAGLVLLTFCPPLIAAAVDPTIFDRALGLAGGFGEAFLNGLLPVWLVWVGRYGQKLPSDAQLPGGKIALALLCAVSLFVLGLETFYVLSS